MRGGDQIGGAASQTIGNFLQAEQFAQQTSEYERKQGEKQLFDHGKKMAANVEPEQLQSAKRGERAQRHFALVLKRRGKRFAPDEAEEVHLVFRDEATIGLAKTVTGLVEGPVTATGPVIGKFVPLWTKTNDLLSSLLNSLREEPEAEESDKGKAALMVRRVLHDRLRRRGGGRAAG